ncbi:MAG: ice-binding family protein [Bacteroidota bacterium]
MKLIKIIPVLAMMFVMLTVGCNDENENIDDSSVPNITSTMPGDNDTKVAHDTNIAATFSEEMDPSSINASTFMVKHGDTDISGDVEYSGLEATFTPTLAFGAGSEFTATITSAAKSINEVNLEADYEWNFTTEGAPSIVSTMPANNDIDIARNVNLVVTFSEEMNPSSINASTFMVKQGDTDISGEIEYSGLEATFTPSVALEAASEFNVTITTDAQNLSEVNIEADYKWNFTTEVVPTVLSTIPTNNDIGVARNTNIVVTFSEEMDPSTINSTTFMVKQGDSDISGDVEYSGVVATFTPSVVFNAASEFTATITTDAKSQKGVNFEEAYEMIFTTSGSETGVDGVNLGSAGNYVILAKTAINNGGTSEVTGDLGLSPAATSYITGLALTDFTGYATSSQVTGQVFAADMADPTPINLTTAVENMNTAYNDAAGRSEIDFLELGTGNIGGKTLSPGVYKWTNTVSIPTDVTLSGSSTDVWIFQIAENLTMSSATRINLTGGANPNNIFWQVAGEVTVGTTSHFEGIILSKTGITFQTGASINGRALAQTAVVLDDNAVTQPAK